MLKTNLTCALVALVGLSACGGSGTNAVPLSTVTERAETLGLFAEDGESSIFDTDVTPSSNLPFTGSANYSGISIVVDADQGTSDINAIALGTAEISANFETGVIDGRADNFFELDNPDTLEGSMTEISDITGERVQGSITFELSQALQGTNLYGGTAAGSVILSTGSQNLDSTVVGGFTGNNAENLFITQNSGTAGVDPAFVVVATQE